MFNVGRVRLRPVRMVRVLVSVGCVTALTIGFYAAAPHDFLNADGIMFPLMSLRHVTPFYWGQDRYLNVVPAMWSWVHNPLLNLQLCLATFALGLALLVWRSSYWLSARARVPRYCALALLAWLTCSLFSAHALWVFGVSCQPYVWSMLLIMWAAEEEWLQPRMSWPKVALVVALMTLAMGINPSAVVLVPCLFVFLPRRRRLDSLLLSGMAVVAMLLMRTWGARSLGASGDYVAMDISHSWQSLRDAILGLRVAFEHTRFKLMMIALCLSVVWGLWCRWAWPAWRTPLLLTLVAVGWLLVFAHSVWVITSGSPYRYFYPTCFLLPFSVVFLVARAVSHHVWLRVGLAVACACDVYPTLAVPLISASEYPVLQNAAGHVAVAPRDQPLMLVGDYWRVWPAMLVCLMEGRPCVAQAYRNGSDSPRLVAEVVHAAETRASALCFGLAASACTAELMRLLPWQVTYQERTEVERGVMMLTLAPRPK